MSATHIVGSRRARLDAPPKTTGATHYTADIRLDGMLVGVIKRCPHPYARVVRVDVSRAQRMPGVHAIAYAANTPETPLDFGIKDQHLFPRPYARFAGEPVAAVAADTQAQAIAAADAIDVEYEILEPVLDARRALEPGAPLVHPDWQQYEKLATRVLRGNVCGYNRIRRGDVAAAFARPDVVLHTSEFRFSPGLPGYIEPRAAVARREPDGGLTVWCGSQSPYDNRDELAKFFGLDPARVRFINQFVGGAFGGKILMAAEWYAAALALQCDRPVRVAWSRHEDGLQAGPRHGGYAWFRSAATKDGTLVAMEAKFIYDTGAYIGYGTGTAQISTMLASGPYRIPNIDLEATLAYTNKQVAGPVRAPGAPQSHYAKELHLDELAARLGLDPLEFRLHNAWEDGDEGPGGQKLSGVRVKEALRACADAIGWRSPAGQGRGRGIACGWWFSSCGVSKARVEIRADGSVLLAAGNPEVGTGASSTTLPMMAAELLGIDPDHIEVVLADTATDTYDSGVGGSSSTFGAGMAVNAASNAARTLLLSRAEDALEARADDLELRDGRVFVRGAPDRSIPFADLARVAGGKIVGEGESLEQDDPEFDESLTETHGFSSWLAPSYTASAAEVEVDAETGVTIVHKIVTAEDVGYAVNPAGVVGQMEGGAVMGVGWALTEALHYEDGQVKPDLADYLMPTAVDAPSIQSIIIESSPGAGPYGLKGCGEPPISTPPAAIACAIRAAVGVAPHETPMTPERIWQALRASRP